VSASGRRLARPNEKVEITQLLKGAEAAAHLWADLAETHPR
jgi:hypothetical protein